MKLIKSPLMEERLELEESGRAKQLRDLWLRLTTIEDRAYLEELWPAMKGRWIGEWGLPPKVDPAVQDLERITDQIRKPDDANEVRRVGLRRMWSKIQNSLRQEP